MERLSVVVVVVETDTRLIKVVVIISVASVDITDSNVVVEGANTVDTDVNVFQLVSVNEKVPVRDVRVVSVVSVLITDVTVVETRDSSTVVLVSNKVTCEL